MCGIIGYIGKKVVDKELVRLLKNLEYRGYDSAGVATLNNGQIEVIKCAGKICNLEKILKGNAIPKCGIAHTRWATHGNANYVNTHPHLSMDETWAIVHNGIIENYSSLKSSLKCKGYKFTSETDTEVIANLLQNEIAENGIKTLIRVCSLLKGSYALACVNRNEKDTLFLARKKSPLYVAKKGEEVVVASDPICFSGFNNEYYSLNDDEFCEANKKGLTFFNSNGEEILKDTTKMELIQETLAKRKYEHFMLKEIEETPEVLRRIVKTYSDTEILKQFNKEYIKRFNRIVLIGCGTAYHAALMGARFLEDFARIECHAYIASEYRYKNPLIDEKTLCILVSQSGETADTLAVCELAKQNGATTIALTNVLYSSLAKMVNTVLPVCAGPEIAVASTKAYTAQITILYMLAKQFQNAIKNKRNNYLLKVEKLANEINIFDDGNLDKLASGLLQANKAFYIGRDKDYLTAEEASLKLKEITYINSSAHPAGELKHGFLALIEKDTYVFVIATNKKLLEKTLNGAHEAGARDGKIVIVSNLKMPKGTSKKFIYIKLQNFSEEVMPIVSIIFFQKLAYLVSIKRGINPDQPRNLAKSVTVE